MVTERSEEIRLALVMNGGVSLAVWMGGVSNEIFRLVQERHPVYADLLAMLRNTARVDVISGTSAGGVNGAALALALLYGGEMIDLRKVWLEMGSINDLMRAPTGKNPGSLLMGDDYFLPKIEEAFQVLARNKTPHEAHPIDLQLTTTLLDGQAGHTVDDLGCPIHDVDFRAHFRFSNQDFADKTNIIKRLARAARSTASFPFAFEPSRVSGTDTLHGATGEKLATPRFVVDGGLLDNKPFRGALKAIFGMPCHKKVRRVLAYINPDPGDTQVQAPAKKMPKLAPVLAASIIGIPQAQTISDQLVTVEAHNKAVRARRNNIFDLLTELDADELKTLADSLFSLYHKRRLANTFEQFVIAPLSQVVQREQERSKQSRDTSSMTGDEVAQLKEALTVLGKHGRAQMKNVFMGMAWAEWLPPAWPQSADHAYNQQQTWEWGLFPVEFAARLLLDMLRLSEMLLDYAAPDAVLTPKPIDTSGEAKLNAVGKPSWYERFFKQCAEWEPETLRAPAAHTDSSSRLGKIWQAAWQQVTLLEKQRADEASAWHTNWLKFLRELKTIWADHQEDITPKLQQAYREMFGFITQSTRREVCAEQVYAIAQKLGELAVEAENIAQACLVQQRLHEHDLGFANALLSMARYFSANGQPLPNRDIVYRVLQLEVIEYAFHDHDNMNEDALIELVQISGNTPSPLQPRALTAADKLLGLQLAHFAAFYKKSWRANDWAFGRLDGAERLIKIILSPERLYRFYYGNNADAAVNEIQRIALESVASPVLKAELQRHWLEQNYRDKIVKELNYLRDKALPLPDALPTCTEVLTLRLHYEILREEIPALRASVFDDQAEGADQAGPSQSFLEKSGGKSHSHTHHKACPFSPEQAAQCLQDRLIAAEQLANEAGSDLFTRTFAHTVATLQNLFTSNAGRIALISTFFALLKLPLLGFHYVARVLLHQSRTSAALNGAILVVGGVLVALQFLWTPLELGTKQPGTLITIGWILLTYGLAMSILRTPWTMMMLFVLALVLTVWLSHSPIVIMVIAALIMWFVVVALSRRIEAFNLLLAIGALAFCAAWGSGMLTYTQVSEWCIKLAPNLCSPSTSLSWLHYPIWVLAAVISVAFVLATIQNSLWWNRLERYLGVALRKLMNPRKDF